MASLPAIFAFIGGVLGGVISDFMIRKGFSISAARKTPLCIGMLLSASVILCNYTDSNIVVMAFMSLAFFGKAMGAMGWSIMADVAPKRHAGLNASIFNTFGGIAGIVTPVVIGYLVQSLHSFNAALVYVGLHALLAIVCFLFIVGEIKRVEL